MTATLTAPATPGTGAAAARARAVLRLDAGVTAGVGLLGLLSPLDWYGDSPTWVVRGIAVALLVVAADLALAARLPARWLRTATTVTAELALAWVAATAVVLGVAELPAAGREVLLLQGVATLGFAVAHLVAARALRT